MKKILFAALAVAALATGCSKEVTLNENPNLKKAIEFSLYTGKVPVLKGTEVTSETIKTSGFGINAAYTGQTVWATGGQTPNFMYNQEVTHTGEGWTYSPLKYWPTTQEDKISFFAWAPFDGAGIAVMGNTEKADKLKFTVQDDPKNTVDFVAGNKINVIGTATPGTVSFNLRHELTRLTFKAKTSEDLAPESHVVLKSAYLVAGTEKYAKEATYQYNAAEGERGTWTVNSSFEADYSIWSLVNTTTGNIGGKTYTDEVVDIISNKNPVTLFNDGEALYLLPVAALAKDQLMVKFEYDIVTADPKLDGGHSCTPAEKTVSLPVGILQQGTSYALTFTFNVDKVVVAADVEGWTEVDGGNVDVDYTDNI